MLCCGYTLTDFPISIRLTSLALWQSNDCPSASKATPMNMDKYFMWIHYERLRNHNKAKHNKTVCIFLGIYCRLQDRCHIGPGSDDLKTMNIHVRWLNRVEAVSPRTHVEQGNSTLFQHMDAAKHIIYSAFCILHAHMDMRANITIVDRVIWPLNLQMKRTNNSWDRLFYL